MHNHLRLLAHRNAHRHFVITAVLAGALLGSPAARAITINVTYGTGANAVPAGAQAIFNQVVANYDAMFSNATLTGPNTVNTGAVNIQVNFGSTGLGESTTNEVAVSYGSWTGALSADSSANPANLYLADAVSSLPLNNPFGSNTCNPSTFSGCVILNSADARAIGITSGEVVGGCLNPSVLCSTPGPDSTLTFSNSICYFDDTIDNPGGCTGNTYNLQNVAEHELDEALGISSTLTGLANNAALPSNFAAEDYFRFTANSSCNGSAATAGTRCLSTTPGDNIYFSYDNGATDVADFFQGPGADRNDWVYGQGGNCGSFPPGPYVQDAFACPGTTAPNIQPGGPVTPEQIVLNTLGYDAAQSAAPEPGSILLIGCGLAAVCLRKRSRS